MKIFEHGGKIVAALGKARVLGNGAVLNVIRVLNVFHVLWPVLATPGQGTGNAFTTRTVTGPSRPEGWRESPALQGL